MTGGGGAARASRPARPEWATRAAWCALAAWLALAVAAPLVAGDLPLLARVGGALCAPVVTGAVDGRRGDDLRAAMTADDWALWPPVAHDPVSVRSAGAVAALAPPSRDHVLGTDDRGRDVAARLIHGARTSLIIAGGAAAVATLLALALALLAARAGGAVDAAVRASCDLVAATPPILAIIAARGLLDARSLSAVIILIAIPRAADTARLVRAALAAAVVAPFAEAARATGAGPLRVLLRHALPQAAPALATAAALTAATAVLAEAGLSFLGIGAPAPTPSWGELLAQASGNDLRPWLAVPAGVAVTAVAASLLAVARRLATAR